MTVGFETVKVAVSLNHSEPERFQKRRLSAPMFRLYGYGDDAPTPPSSMDEATAHAVAHIAQSSQTRQIRDRAAQAALIRSARSHEERDWIMQMILCARAQWLAWLTNRQRQWQANTSRRPAKARHHDSLKIRERYVRCHS